MPARDRLPVSVPQNRWDEISVPDLGTWEPALTISIVLPYYERSHELNLTLAALGEQTYPPHLVQAIVVDDGSPTDPPMPPESLGFDLQVVTQEDLGYGLTRARNLGARLAEGEVVLFLDCDMIPERQLVEAHARWHHQARRLLTLGFRRHAEFSSLTPGEIATAVRGDSVETLFRPSEISRPEWVESHMERTDDMLEPVDDLYVIMSGGNLGVDRDLYWEAGGNDENFTRWGGEDNEFAYRAMLLGAVFVPERRAMAWHQGEGHEPSADELESLKLQRPRLQGLIANPSTRRFSPGRVYERPHVTVFVPPGGEDIEVLGATIDSLLASSMSDLVVGVGPVNRDEDRSWLQDTYRGDPRVVLNVEESEFLAQHPFSPVRLRLPSGFAVGRGAVGAVVDQVAGPGVGLLHITLPGVPTSNGMARAWLTRAENRVRTLEPMDQDLVIGRLFGERWISGRSIGLWRIQDAALALGVIGDRDPHVTALHEQLEFLEWQLWQANETIGHLSSRRAVLLADGIGQLARARTLADLAAGLKVVLATVLPRRTTG